MADDLAQRRLREAALTDGRWRDRAGPDQDRVDQDRPDGVERPMARSLIEASWRRMRSRGLDPGSAPDVPPLEPAELERRRSESRLTPLVPHLREALGEAIDIAGQLMVVTDADGRVLWRDGRPGVRRLADSLGFVGGSAWTEGNVGTNAIGTALVVDGAVHIVGAEHYVESHTRWGCAAAPIRDPWTGDTLGVVDVSGPVRSMHPSAVAMVRLAARVAELEVRQSHLERLESLRAHAAPLVARVGGRALVVDQHGHLAAVTGMTAPQRVSLPTDLSVGEVWLPTLGAATAEALPGGWLLRLGPGSPEYDAAALVVDLTAEEPTLTVSGPSGAWTRRLSPRHTEILVALVVHPAGRSAAELSSDLFADASRVVTVRAELSRLRRVVGPLLLHRPYRFATGISRELRLPEDRGALLPGSSAPVLARLRDVPRSPPGAVSGGTVGRPP